MTEPTNPLFEDEKEFLERKKLEYERALRGDVTHLKDQSVVIGKVALAGAGVAGGIWLLSKAFGGKKKRKRRPAPGHDAAGHYDDWDDHADGQSDGPGFQEYYTDGLGNRRKSKFHAKSARASAQAFMDDEGFQDDFEDHAVRYDAPDPAADKYAAHSLPFVEDDPFQSVPYDDSRRMPASQEFPDDGMDYDSNPAAAPRRQGSSMVGEVLKTFLQSDTGKVLVAQAAAVVLALVTKKVTEAFPALAGGTTAKNADLAAGTAALAAPVASFYDETGTSFRPESAPATPDAPPANPPA